MDNLTHTLFASALAKTPLGRRSHLQFAMMCIAANLPDADALPGMLWNRESYYRHHRDISHSLIGVTLQAGVLAALLVWIQSRLQRRSGTKESLSFRATFPGILLAALSHIALDWITSDGIRPWLPFSGERYFGDLTFIVDPWLWIFLGGATSIAGPKTRIGSIILACLAVACTLAIAWLGHVHAGFAALWMLSLALIIGLRAHLFRTESWALPLYFSTLPGAVYLTTMAGLGSRLETLTAVQWQLLHPGGTIVSTSRTPLPGTVSAWKICIETKESVYVARIDWTNAEAASFAVHRKFDQTDRRMPCMRAERVKAWSQYVRLPAIRILTTATGARVQLFDARVEDEPDAMWSTLDLGAFDPPGIPPIDATGEYQ